MGFLLCRAAVASAATGTVEDITIAIMGNVGSGFAQQVEVLRMLRLEAEARVGQHVVRALLAVPTQTPDSARNELRTAAQQAGLAEARIVNAAAAVLHSDRQRRALWMAEVAPVVLAVAVGGEVTFFEADDGVLEVVEEGQAGGQVAVWVAGDAAAAARGGAWLGSDGLWSQGPGGVVCPCSITPAAVGVSAGPGTRPLTILPRNMLLPARRSRTLKVRVGRSGRVALDVHAGEHTARRRNEWLGTLVLPEQLPASSEVEVEVEIEVGVDEQLRVTAWVSRGSEEVVAGRGGKVGMVVDGGGAGYGCGGLAWLGLSAEDLMELAG